MKTKTIILSALIYIIGLSFLKAQDHKTDSINFYKKAAQEAVKTQDFLTYQNNIEKIVKLAPADYMSRFMLARAYVINENKEKAIEQLKFLAKNNYDLIIYAEKDRLLSSLKSEAGFKSIEAKINEMKRPLINSSLAFSIKEKDLFPEGMTYDPVGKAFYIGSIHKGKIIKVDKNGKVTDFIKAGQDGLLPTVGLRIDTKRQHLWVISSFGRANSSISQEFFGSSGVFKYNLKTGKLIKKYMLKQEEKHFLNDLVISSKGDVYLTDSYKPAVYKISAKVDKIEKFVDLEGFPNGIAFTPDESKLFVASESIYLLDIKTKKAINLKHHPALSMGADGMYFYKNSLVIIQNSIQRVVRMYLNDDFTEIEKYENLEINNPIFNIPTTGVIIKDTFYFIANSQLTDYNEKGEIFPLSKLVETQILKIKLK